MFRFFKTIFKKSEPKIISEGDSRIGRRAIFDGIEGTITTIWKWNDGTEEIEITGMGMRTKAPAAYFVFKV